MNIDDTTKEYFRRGKKLFYGRKLSRIDLYGCILTLFFHKGKELRNGVFVPLLPPSNELPTFNQFRYWYKNLRDLTYSGAAYHGSHTFDVRSKVDQGQQLPNIPGPGFQFEIHEFIADIYLVSILNRLRILGRPVICLIIDVFSGVIVGMSVSLEGPNRQGTMLALENMACDKITYCKGYGVHITEDDWPSHHLPKTLLANSSEFLLKNADFLVNVLGIQISNAQPYRLDCKERFERCFPIYDLHDDMAIHSLPEQGRESHRLDNCLTLNDFRRLVIDCIIEHNTAHHLSDEYLDAEMIANGVEPYPRDAWKWGIEHRADALRTCPTDVLNRALLIEAKASVTTKGICFRGLNYTCDNAIQERWLEHISKGMNERFTVPIFFDPRTPGHIYVRTNSDQPLEMCRLHHDNETLLIGCDWFEIEDIIAHQRGERVFETQRNKTPIEHREARDSIIEEARSWATEVRKNRSAEKERDREMTVWDTQEHEDCVVEHPSRIFKGTAEHFFASITRKLDH
jgi:putative transposase